MYFRRGYGLALLLIVIGLGVAFGCLKGLVSGEGMYDRDSRQVMFWSQLLGLILGLAVAALGLLALLRLH